MQLHNSKIQVSSIVYVASLVVMTSIFGLWHNTQLRNGTQDYLIFNILLILSVSFFSWFYFITFKVYRKKFGEKISMEVGLVSEPEIAETLKSEEKLTNFDKDAFISGIVPAGKKLVPEFCEAVLQNLSEKLNVVQGLFFVKQKADESFEPVARYAYYSDEEPPAFKIGESLTGQAIKDNRVLIVSHVPENYIPIVSGLGSSKPKNLILLPITADNEPVGLIEIAVFKTMDTSMEPALKELGGLIGKNIIKLMK